MDVEKLLIIEVKDHPILYDPKNPDYNDKLKRNEVWRIISQKLIGGTDSETSVLALKNRWKCLRDSYVKEERFDLARNSGIELKNKKPWRLKKQMNFLSPYIHIKKSSTVRNGDNFPCSSTTKERLNDIVSPVDNCQKIKKNVFNQSISNSEQDDFIEIDSFFRGIADAVRGLKRKNQLLVQREVTNIVMEYKLQELEEDENKSIRGQ